LAEAQVVERTLVAETLVLVVVVQVVLFTQPFP
jgi:hypothetical protein